MEILYAKLHDKYEKLKVRKFTEIDRSLQDQEEKFMNYVSVAENLIEELRTENETLNGEMHSIRSSCDNYERLLSEEREKTKELLKEVERLQNLQQEIDFTPMEESTDTIGRRRQSSDIVPYNSPGNIQVGLEDAITIFPRRSPRFQSAVAQPNKSNQLDLSTPFSTNSQGGHVSNEDQDHQQKNCNVADPVSAGGCAGADFMLLTLMESLAGLKFSIVNEAEKTFLSAVHQASGYSFRISLLNEAEKTEMLYEVLSLGTIGRVAVDWMKEDISFSLHMFPIFMNQISLVLGLK